MHVLWNGSVVARSQDTVVVEGNHYFLADSINPEYFSASDTTSACHWKGTAKYKTLNVDGESNPDAAWYYPDPKPAAAEIRDYVAFFKWRRNTALI